MNSSPYQMVEMWKRTSTVRVKNLVDLRDLLQGSTDWDPLYILRERKFIPDNEGSGTVHYQMQLTIVVD